MKSVIANVLCRYWKWRSHRKAKRLGIVSFNFTTKRQLEEFPNWKGHNWTEWREFYKCLGGPKGEPVKDTDIL